MKVTRKDIFDKLMEVLELLTASALQGDIYSPKILFLINETVGELMEDPEFAQQNAVMIKELLPDSLEVENQKKPAVSTPPVIPINKKLN